MMQIEHNSSEIVTLDKAKKGQNKGHAQKDPAPQEKLSDSAERAYKLEKFVQEIEKYEAQKSAISEAIKACYDAASANDFDKKALKQVIADRQKDQQELELFEENVSDLKDVLKWAEENPRWKKAV